MIYRHAKLLAEAIPALSTPAGGSPVVIVGSNPMENININEDPLIRPRTPQNEVALWPAALDGRKGKVKRWLHGDYKDAAYVYVKGLYDRIVFEGGLK